MRKQPSDEFDPLALVFAAFRTPATLWSAAGKGSLLLPSCRRKHAARDSDKAKGAHYRSRSIRTRRSSTSSRSRSRARLLRGALECWRDLAVRRKGWTVRRSQLRLGGKCSLERARRRPSRRPTCTKSSLQWTADKCKSWPASSGLCGV